MTRFRAISLFLIVAILLQMGAVTVSPKSAAAASTGPILKSQSPANGSFITPDRGIRITFDENVRKGSGNIIFGSEVYPVATDDVHIQWETTKTILIKPTDLAIGQDYSVIIEAGAFIGVTSGLPSAEYDLGTFSVRSLGVLDLFDETVASPYYPDNGDVDIDADRSVTLKLYFNHSGMKIGTGNVYIKKYADNTIAQTIKTSTTATKITSATVGGEPVSFTSIPMSKLANSTKYYVMIDPGAFVDEYGNPFPGITNKDEWTFTTEELFDTVPPTASNFVFISSGSVDSAGGLNGVLSVTFSEKVYTGSGAIEIRKSDNTTYCSIPVGAGAVTLDSAGKVVTISPSVYACPKFVNGSTYKLVIGSQAFRDGNGNYYAGQSGWSFKAAVDNSLPSVSIYSPAVSAKAVSVNTTTLTLTFNKAVKQVGDDVITAVAFPQSKPSTASERINWTVSFDSTDNKKIILTKDDGEKDFNPNTKYVVNIPAGVISDLAGNLYPGMLNLYQWTFDTGAAGGIPTLQKAEMDGASIVLTYNETLNPDTVPYADNYYATVSGSFRQVTGVSVSGAEVRLSLQQGVVVGQSVKLSYTPQLNDASRHIQTLLGKVAAAFTNRDVTNTTSTTLPRPMSGAISGALVTLNFNRELAALPSNVNSLFYVTSGSSRISVSSATLSGSTLLLLLPSQPSVSGAITVSYTPGSIPIRDLAGNTLAAFAGFALTNPNDTTAPVFLTGAASGKKIVLNYDEALRTSPVPAISSYSVLSGGKVLSISSVAINGTAVELTLAQSLADGALVTLNYFPGASYVADIAGNPAPLISGYSMTVSGGSTARLSSAVINGNVLTLAYSTPLNTLSSSIPNVSQYTVKANGVTIAVRSVYISAQQVVLSLMSDVQAGQQVLLSYTNTGNPLKDTLGQTVETFSNYSVVNQTTDTGVVLPEFLEPDGNGGIRLVNSKAVVISSGVTLSGKVANKYSIDGDKLYNGFSTIKQGNATQPVLVAQIPETEAGAIVSVNVRSLINAAALVSNGILKVNYGDASFSLPLKAVNYTDQLQGSGYDTNSVQLIVRIEKSSTTSLTTALTKKGGTLVGNVYDFSVALLLGSVERTVSEFDSYVERSISVNSSGLTASELTVVRLDAESGDATYVPTSTETSSGKIKVKFSRKGNSIYAVMRKAPLVYSDMTNHWSKSDVSKLAAKFIVSGINSTQYKPEQAITRAEFAEYIARGLGLTGDKSVVTSKYKDVPATGASAAFIGAASKAGIVSGGTDGKFRPNDPITREEMASLLVRAMKYAGVTTTASSTALNKFTDKAKISSWAKDGVAACVQAGIISGVTPTTVKPQNNAKRSEAASMITRFLKYVELLDA